MFCPLRENQNDSQNKILFVHHKKKYSYEDAHGVCVCVVLFFFTCYYVCLFHCFVCCSVEVQIQIVCNAMHHRQYNNNNNDNVKNTE